MPELRPIPVPHAPDDGATASRAWAEALAMTREDADAAHRSRGELVAAALSAHRTLSRDFGRGVPVTALGPEGTARGLAAFVAVYAVRQQRHERQQRQQRHERQAREQRELRERQETSVRRDGHGLGEAA
ncbi:hypothetical protein LRR80_04671 [Streptomyces sp. RO-S4]|uniref:hypothetical protein n=1 Tax=Streptomyces sp. RO-S4 TaxID=2902486 RepID=UPI00208FB795|nr:hypothetical protein [Streptomyces sp. RO-S4]MCO4698588.1 hypothetical protein [Streptomyces sp. RO-S4]